MLYQMLYQMILNYLTNPRNPSNMVKSYPTKVTRKRSTQIRFAERAAHRLEGGLGTVCGR